MASILEVAVKVHGLIRLRVSEITNETYRALLLYLGTSSGSFTTLLYWRMM